MQNMIVYDYLFAPAGPRSTAAAVSAENMPQAYFPNASTVLKEIIALSIYLVFISLAQNAGLFFVLNVFAITSLFPRVLAEKLCI